MSYIKINGLSVSEEKIVLLPNGAKIVLADSGVCPPWNKNSEQYFTNHNIFRLDAANNVIWQVQRDEQHAAEWWVKALKKAARGDKEMQYQTNKPFARLSTAFFKRGIYNEFEETPAKYISEIWKSDYVLLAWGYGRAVYELDIETGVAKNITQPGGRDW